MQYESTYPANGYACTLTALGGDPNSGAPSPQRRSFFNPTWPLAINPATSLPSATAPR